MAKDLPPFRLSLAACESEMADFRRLVSRAGDLSESGDILPFFTAHPNLAALIGTLAIHVHRIGCLAGEFDLFGNFRCDWCVGDPVGGAYEFIEFEDARATSVFADGTKYHAEWGRRFEHGFSQLVDWFWAVDQYRGNVDFQRRFGTGPVEFSGILVVGRRGYLSVDQLARLRWRVEKVWVNGHKVFCTTVDDLYDHFESLLRFYRDIERRADQP